jgi:hypothetical protein
MEAAKRHTHACMHMRRSAQVAARIKQQTAKSNAWVPSTSTNSIDDNANACDNNPLNEKQMHVCGIRQTPPSQTLRKW